MIDRVEIVRGPRSSLYGADAIGGVIQVFTRRDRERLRPARAPRRRQQRHAAATASASAAATTAAGSAPTTSTPAPTASTPATASSTRSRSKAPAASSPRFAARPRRLREGRAVAARRHRLQRAVEPGRPRPAQRRRQRVRRRLHRPCRDRAAGDRRQAALASVRARRPAPDRGPQRRLLRQLPRRRLPRLLQHQPRQRHAAGRLRHRPGPAADSVGLDWLRRQRREHHAPTTRTSATTRLRSRSTRAASAHSRCEASVRRDDNEQFGGHTTGSAAWGLGFAEQLARHRRLRHRVQGTDLQRAVLPVLRQPEPAPEESETWELGLALPGDSVQRAPRHLQHRCRRPDRLRRLDQPAQQRRQAHASGRRADGRHHRRRLDHRRRRSATSTPRTAARILRRQRAGAPREEQRPPRRRSRLRRLPHRPDRGRRRCALRRRRQQPSPRRLRHARPARRVRHHASR